MNINRRQFLESALLLTVAGGCVEMRQIMPGRYNDWVKTLSEHRIAGIEAHTVRMKYPRLVGKNARKGIHGAGPKVGICIVNTEKGIQGWGAFRGGTERAKSLLEKCKGRPITDFFDPAIGIIDIDAMGLDFAFHDLAGVILGIPVYEMLGSNGPLRTDCYSGMIYFDDLEPQDNPVGNKKVLDNCKWDIDYGYRQLKVKIGRGNRWMKKQEGLKRDIEVTLAIAEAFPEIDILVDGNDGFTVDESIQYLEGLGDLDLFWFEEPFRENHEGFSKLREWLNKNQKKTYIADGEYRPDHQQLLRLARQGLLDVHLSDIQGYGFTQWRRLMPVLKEIGILASPHAWGHALKSNYIAHIAAGLGNVVTIEGVTCTCKQVDFSGYQLQEGKLAPPKLPGFGMKILI